MSTPRARQIVASSARTWSGRGRTSSPRSTRLGCARWARGASLEFSTFDGLRAGRGARGSRKALTLFCTEGGADYMQGLNEVLAPFILLAEPPQPSAMAYCLFRRVVQKLWPTMFSSREISSLQFQLRLFHEVCGAQPRARALAPSDRVECAAAAHALP